ncbi:cytochrome ubiquinol oxidase subunit I [Thermococcus waiotapuensis]|uniref:Cytochrome ubiquinol oxidase subunit I n=1 Tax=Thermococcus waiotapuensis TaxID=90909 RepID=A0AAE4NU40_9EURY|nr:cytochrome ubiquinol oxidase subunit I [Thermococcus waiotapuensis]MDV3103889.1 cytochrome ubiquinol oxidase subunit I [Thermococcus waiotapuensis]
MDPVLLSRIQFALTAAYHWIFVPGSIGLAFMVFLLWTMAAITNEEQWHKAAKFFSKWLGVFFVLGVPSGIVMEFEFGANWANYSTFVGSIFGPPLMLEGLFAFALESTFIGVLLFGMDRLPRVISWISSFFVFIGSSLSGLWILIANSWQQVPSAYIIKDTPLGPRAELTDFMKAVFNPLLVSQYTHTINSAIITGAYIVTAVGAYYLLKKRHVQVARSALAIGIVVLAISSIIQLYPTGHEQGRVIAEYQPTKLAADEGLYRTESGAPMLVFGIVDEKNQEVKAAVGIPKLLSWLAFGDWNAKVLGLHDAAEYVWYQQVLNNPNYADDNVRKEVVEQIMRAHGVDPNDPQANEKMVRVLEDALPVAFMFYAYRVMVGLGVLFILIGLVGVLLLLLGKLYDTRWFLRVLLVTLPLPWLASESGWFTHEIGRQPWMVWGMVTVNTGVSQNISATSVLITLIGFVVVYSILFYIWLHFVKKLVIEGPEPVEGDATSVPAPALSAAGGGQ